PVIVGTSAGAVSAAVLAGQAHHWRRAIAGLEEVWANFHIGQVFHAGTRHMIRGGLHWALALLSGGLVLHPPRSGLDNSPLRELLAERVSFSGIPTSLARGHLHGVALCATSYVTGQSVAFFDAVEGVEPWERAQRLGRRTRLPLDHLMASAAVPLLLPAVRLGNEYFGDGAMRQLNPLSPA